MSLQLSFQTKSIVSPTKQKPRSWRAKNIPESPPKRPFVFHYNISNINYE